MQLTNKLQKLQHNSRLVTLSFAALTHSEAMGIAITAT